MVVGAVTAAAAVPLGVRAVDHIRQKIDAARLSGHEVTVWLLDGSTGTSLAVVLAVLLLAGVVYEVLPTVKWGRTLGKKLCGLEVRDIAGEVERNDLSSSPFDELVAAEPTVHDNAGLRGPVGLADDILIGRERPNGDRQVLYCAAILIRQQSDARQLVHKRSQGTVIAGERHCHLASYRRKRISPGR